MGLMGQILFALLVVVITCLIVLKIYLTLIKGKCTSNADLTGKTAVVTGANTGIGYWTALDFARRNARVILACRNIAKAQKAADEIIEASGNKNVHVRELDVSVLGNVRQFAKKFLQEEDQLDILVNNAGVSGVPLERTEDGFDLTHAANYWGHFLLTNLLLDLMKRSESSRVVNVSSVSHKWTKKGIDFDELKSDKPFTKAEAEERKSIREAYACSKLANVLFTRELARRLQGTGVTTNSLHPGAIRSEIWRHVKGPYKLIYNIISTLYFKSSEEGAETTIHCAVSEEVEGISGKYFVDCKVDEGQASDMSRDMQLAKKLWDVSEKYTGLAK